MLPSSVKYRPTRMELQIPSLNVMTDMISIESLDGSYPVDWLEMNTGLLAESALPGEGVSVIVGHNTLNAAEYGPFILIGTMQIGDRFFVRTDENRLMIFEVYNNEKIASDDYEALYIAGGKFDSTITLLTCEDEMTEGGYASRRIISARQIF